MCVSCLCVSVYVSCLCLSVYVSCVFCCVCVVCCVLLMCYVMLVCVLALACSGPFMHRRHPPTGPTPLSSCTEAGETWTAAHIVIAIASQPPAGTAGGG